jgi:hypothetical protein
VRSGGAREEIRLNRIDATFARLHAAGRTGLIPYVTVGDPTLKLTLPIMHALVAVGADVIELGVPFSIRWPTAVIHARRSGYSPSMSD